MTTLIPLPFQFTTDGQTTLSPELPPREGIRGFIQDYVKEWVLWHQAGCINPTVCDLAALRVAAIHSYYQGQTFHLDARLWLETVFQIPKNLNFMEFQLDQISRETLILLAQLRAIEGASASCSLVPEATMEELLSLALPSEQFLILGGDQRLALDPVTLLNGYGCRPFPRPEAFTFSSSTATSISQYAFDVVEKRRQVLIREALCNDVTTAAMSLGDDVRQKIGENLRLGNDQARSIISSSGTDSFLVVQGLIHLMVKSTLTTVMVGPDESGTGVPMASQERHFATKAAMGHQVEKGELLHGCNRAGEFIEVFLHDRTRGEIPAAEIDEKVSALVEEKLATGVEVVIHAMNHSKLGRMGPTPPLLLRLKEKHGDRLHIVIDACQMRLDMDELHGYLKNDFLVIITGSKFFTGPPLSGAILIPPASMARILSSNQQLPEGFNAYCGTCDLSADLRRILIDPKQGYNLGSYFRWIAALAEMKRYFKVPAALRKNTLDHICHRVEQALLEHASLELLYERHPSDVNASTHGELSGRRMIFPFYLTYQQNGQKKLCTLEQAKTIYTLLNQDCSTRFQSYTARDYRLLTQRCHIGQPVKTVHRSGESSAVLRLNIGARVISETWSAQAGGIEPELIDDEIWQVNVVLNKLELLLQKMSEGTL